MFKRYAVQTQSKLVRDKKSDDTTTEQNPLDNVEIVAAYAEIVKDVITHAAFTIGGVWAACKIVERICR